MTSNGTDRKFLSDELRLRIISAVILAFFVLLITWIGGRTFELLCIVVAILIFYEFTTICRTRLQSAQKFVALAFLILVLAAGYTQSLSLALTILFLGAVLLALWEMITQKSFWSPVALTYAALPYFAMSQLRGSTNDGLLVIIVLFACVWGADVFAYFSGKAIGGPKLAPKISPKKTWAGFVGGMIGALVLAFAVVNVAGYGASAGFFALILVCALISQLGDLAESFVKRKFEIKDSGNLIPGHGGILDRIDGLIPAAVALWVILNFNSGDPESSVQLGTLFANAFLLP